MGTGLEGDTFICGSVSAWREDWLDGWLFGKGWLGR